MNTPRKRLRRVPLEEVGLQIAPMVDVTLLLLFFFMLSGKLSGEAKRREISVPVLQTEATNPIPSGAEVVNVSEKGALFAGDRPVSAAEWGALLRAKRHQTPQLRVVLRAEAATPAERIRAVLQTAAEAGVQEIHHAVRTP